MQSIAIPKKITEVPSEYLVWVFQISGMIGISMGFQDWFLPKTPLTLLVLAMLILWQSNFQSTKAKLVIAFCFFVGMTAEWIGVRYDWLFGTYYYGDNLGWKLGAVPLLIGVNWAVLSLCTARLVSKLKTHNIILVSAAGSALMIILDYFMEYCAHAFDFWHFSHGLAPARNYLSWFLIGFGLQYLIHRHRIYIPHRLAGHIYLSLLVFFIYFSIYTLGA